MESTIYIKYIRISPKKLRFAAAAVRDALPTDVLKKLSTSPERAHKVLYKVVKSAVAAATARLNVEADGLRFKLFAIEEAPFLKRMRPGGRGMARLYKRRFSHIKITLIGQKKK